MRVIDLSRPIRSLATPVFTGYPQPLRTTFATLADNSYQSYFWSIGEHTATHVDAPNHFIKKGRAIDNIPISRFVSNGVVLDFSKDSYEHVIHREDVEKALEKNDAVGPELTILFHTRYQVSDDSELNMKYPDLTAAACRYLAQIGVSAIGFDSPSPDHDSSYAHKILLKKDILIYENLTNLEKLLGRRFLFVGTPLPLQGGTASPVRAVALLGYKT